MRCSHPATTTAYERGKPSRTTCDACGRRLRREPAPEPLRRCREHRPGEERLPYLAWHELADASARRGERQEQCGECGHYFWPWERLPRARRSDPAAGRLPSPPLPRAESAPRGVARRRARK